MKKEHELIMLPTDNQSNVLLGIPQHLYLLSNEEIKECDWMITNFNQICQANKFFVNVQKTGAKKIIATTDTSLTIGKCWCMKPEVNGCSECTKCLPNFPQSFINYFIKQYNKGNVIKKVMVEYEADLSNNPYSSNKLTNALKALKESADIGCKLKVDSNNCISIVPQKESWSRDEVIELCKKAFDNSREFNSIDGIVDIHIVSSFSDCRDLTPVFSTNKEWIEQNL